jgi:hypothetical protein
MATRPDAPPEPKIDPASLFLEEVFTDRKVGTIRRLSPVTPEGGPDASRTILYIGETQIMSNVGAIPIVFEITANSVGDAATQFGPLAKEAIEKTVRELQEMRRQQSSGLVIPGGGGMGGMGGLGGGGKIQMP